MIPFKKRILLLCLAGLFAVPALAGTHKPAAKKPVAAHAAAKAKPKAAKAPVKKKASAKAGRKSGTSSRAKAAPAARAASGAKGRTTCTTVRVKTSKGWKNQRKCTTRRVASAAPQAPALTSPIGENALTRGPAAEAPLGKTRAAPERAYAVDGNTFFYQGRKYKVAGLKAADHGDMAKQRLQRSLEGGQLSVSPVGTDAAGVSTATVRVGGQDIAEQLR